ncbi:MAG: hypothetical protein B7Y45_06020 [Sphingomonas sp. 28-66-16]|nr:MAG: hypothetical protein B7Y45_06020 [Sphingomonas sp. 28-66-16]
MGADQNIDWKPVAASALAWWHEAGVDALVGETPRRWLIDDATPRSAATAPAAAARAAPAPPTLAMPGTLAEFEAWRLGPQAPDAGWSGARIGAQGNAASGLVIIVETPERDDAETGRLLSGPAGRIFDRMLAAIGRDRQSIYLAPMAVVRPATGRLPGDVEGLLGLALRHQIGLAAPRGVLLFGNAASRAVLGADVSEMRGGLRSFNHDGRKMAVVTSHHPRFLLERPAAKLDVWKDLQLLNQGLTA